MKSSIKQLLALGLLGVCAATTPALADEDGRERDRGKTLEASCWFDGDKTDCRAWFEVSLKRNGDYESADRDRHRDELRVVCGGDEIFDGDADVDFHRGKLIVSAEDHDGPSVILKLRDHDRGDSSSLDREDRDNRVPAALVLDEGQSRRPLRGFCKLDLERDHDLQ